MYAHSSILCIYVGTCRKIGAWEDGERRTLQIQKGEMMANTVTNEDPWWSDIHYGWVSWFACVHTIGIIGVWYTFAHASVATIFFAIAYFFLCHLAIACGAHRLYSHRAYHATAPLQYVLLLFFSGTMQGPVIWWVGKHRKHHRFTDSVNDPHSPCAHTFFFGHMGWMCTKAGIEKVEDSYMRIGKAEMRPVLWQYRHYWVLAVAMGLVVPSVVPIFWGDILGGVLVAGFARLMAQYHLTWVVNSLGHTWGARVEGGGTATNVPLLGLVTVGESYHANHHADEIDWRLGRRWYDLDPGKWVIAFFMWVGLATPRQRGSNT